jgi:predicted dehydrogenase
METLIHTKPRLGFAGVGWIGRNRMQAAAESGLADIRLITDISSSCAGDACRSVPGSKAIPSFEELITHPGIDAVVIATPSALHMKQAVAAFENNKSVFCQKPLGRNAEEVTAVVEAARKANKLLGADFSYRYTTAFRKIFPIIQSGELGKIFAVDLKFHNAYGPDKSWFYDKKLSGGGCVLDLGIHLIDLMLYSLNFPEVTKLKSSLYAKGTVLRDSSGVEDFANVMMTLDNEVDASLSCSWNLQAGCEAVIEASFFGTKGGVALKNINGSFYDFIAQRFRGTKTETLAEPPDAWSGRALVHWIKQLGFNPDYKPDAEDFIKSAEVLDRIYGTI